SSRNDPKLSADQVKKISEKLQELVGETGSGDEKGESKQLINEEGLPIIELNEPLDDAKPSTSSEPTIIPNEPNLMPLASLPASERERRRIERDRILDLLEQEESIQHARNEETEQTQRRETSQKRQEEAQFEMEKLRVAREMQKKMGKALLRDMAEARAKEEEKAQKEALLQDRITEEQKTTLKPKKSVSFADLPPGDGESKARTKIRKKEVQFDWGDVAPAKLRSANKSTLMTKTQMNRHLMKLDVVERLPTVQSEHEESIIQVQDSDDESIGSLDPEVADSGSGEDDPEDGLLSEDDEFDLDTARHHREIALTYYEKRNAIGQRAAAINTGEDEWNQPVCEVPLDATLSSSQPKPTVSRFKAERIASSYKASPPSASTSLGTSVFPAGSQTLKRAIRTGRLEDDKLVGGETGESASEPEDENVKEVLELLKQGQVHNIGPTFDSAANSTASGPSQYLSSPHSALTHESRGNLDRPAVSGGQTATGASTPPPKANPKASKFKLNRTAGLPPVAGSTPPDSSRNTPISTVERSSPKLELPATSADEAENGPSVTSSPAFLSNFVKSPSLNPPSTQFTTIVDSPSFPPPRQKPSSYTDVTVNASAASERRLDRPPTVMSAAVLESSGNLKKVSRFRAERM
ncbi:hypothetical protein PILCRDRAFT_74170, partial [Piloderma croceum F 1598]